MTKIEFGNHDALEAIIEELKKSEDKTIYVVATVGDLDFTEEFTIPKDSWDKIVESAVYEVKCSIEDEERLGGEAIHDIAYHLNNRGITMTSIFDQCNLLKELCNDMLTDMLVDENYDRKEYSLLENIKDYKVATCGYNDDDEDMPDKQIVFIHNDYPKILLDEIAVQIHHDKAFDSDVHDETDDLDLSDDNLYHYYGNKYQYLPTSIVPTLLQVHSFDRSIDWKKMLMEIEECIRDVYERDKRLSHEPWNRNEKKTHEILKILLAERKHCLRKLFVLTQESFDAFNGINANLLDMHDRMVDKMRRLYSDWLENPDDGWGNDCQISGRIIVEQTKDGFLDDATDSDYAWMMERIEEVDGNNIQNKEFSGAPDKNCEDYWTLLEHECPNRYFCGGGKRPYGDFLMCKAFQHLYNDSLYAPQDILRIRYYWCDVALTHQRITNDKGDLQ